MHPKSLRIIAIAVALTAQTAIASQYAERDRTAVAGREAYKSTPSVLLPAPQRHLLDERSLFPATENRTYAGEGKSLISASKSTIRFIPNRGQLADTEGKVRPDLLYTADAPGARLYFRREGVSYVFTKHERPEDTGEAGDRASPGGPPFDPGRDPGTCTLYRMDMLFDGANPFPRISASEELEGVSHYYLAHCSEGITHVPAYGCITYEKIYRNIDLVYHSSGGRVKYEFIVHPGGEVSDIRLRFSGAAGMQLDESGDLRVTTPLGEVIEQAPVTYQHGGRSVESSFILEGDVLRYRVGEYDWTADLIIDPWATYIGGSAQDNATGITMDGNGNVIITGFTQSMNFPVTNSSWNSGGLDAFTVKYNGIGMMLWATYCGGNSRDWAFAICADGSGNIVITGDTGSANFPVTNSTTLNGIYNMFVVKFTVNGTVLWATYYGGNGGTYGNGIDFDGNGNILIVGHTNSTNLPVTNSSTLSGTWDGHVVKFDANGTVKWATYYGGSYQDQVIAIATDVSGDVFFTGWTQSPDIPVTNSSQFCGGYDAFIAKLNGNGAVQWATYCGGGNTDQGYGISVDGNGYAAVTGTTASSNFPVTNSSILAGGSDIFIVKYNGTGTVQWSSYYGGSGNDYGNSIAMDGSGTIAIGGNTTSMNFPVTNNSTHAGGEDAFVMKLNNSGTLLWATYYGGNGIDRGNDIAVDGIGSIAISGLTYSMNIPVTNSSAYGGGPTDGFVVHFDANGTFPVELLSFSAQRTTVGEVLLRWTTASEQSNLIFVVERNAGNEGGWSSVGAVSGMGNASCEHAYSFVDVLTTNIISELLLRYRLLQVDYQGSSSYSPVVEVRNPAAPQEVCLSVYPNPASEKIFVQYSLPAALPVRIIVYSTTGRELCSFESTESYWGDNRTVILNITGLAAGVYNLELTAGDMLRVRRFIMKR